MKKIKLTRGCFALVDDDDYEFINQFKWHVTTVKGGLKYAERSVGKDKKMHRVIMPTPDGVYIDHIDGNGLNNQKHNLRRATSSQNGMNRVVSKNNISGYKGVCPSRKKWMAKICVNGKVVFLGTFNTPIEAAKAYDKAAIDLFGSFAKLNLKN